MNAFSTTGPSSFLADKRFNGHNTKQAEGAAKRAAKANNTDMGRVPSLAKLKTDEKTKQRPAGGAFATA